MTRPTRPATVVLAIAGTVVGLLLLVPILIFGTAMAIASPAHQDQVATDCTTTPPTGTVPGVGAAPAGPWRPPVQQAYVLTSPYGMRTDPITGIPRMHRGQDLATRPEPGPIVAAAAGTVTHAGWDPYGLGNSVFLAHPGGIVTEYGHMSILDPAITIGVTVYAGQQLGHEGSTGHSTGNHLHFQVAINGTTVDPVPFMAARGAPLDGRAIAPTPAPATQGAGPTTSSTGAGPNPGTLNPGDAPTTGFALPAPGTPGARQSRFMVL